MLTEAAGPSIPPRTDRAHQGSRRRRGCGGGRACLDRTGRLPAGGVEDRSRTGERAGRGANVEIPSRNGAFAGLPRGRALGLRPFLRALGVGGRRVTRHRR